MNRILLIPLLMMAVSCDLKPLPSQSQVTKKLKPLEGQTLIVYVQEGQVTMNIGAHVSDSCPNAAKAKKNATRRILVTVKDGRMIGPDGNYEKIAGLCTACISEQ